MVIQPVVMLLDHTIIQLARQQQAITITVLVVVMLVLTDTHKDIGMDILEVLMEVGMILECGLVLSTLVVGGRVYIQQVTLMKVGKLLVIIPIPLQ